LCCRRDGSAKAVWDSADLPPVAGKLEKRPARITLGAEDMPKSFVILIITLLVFGGAAAHTRAESQGGLTPRAYLPVLIVPGGCATSSTNSYDSGVAFQFDTDNPVRPAHNHADKNIDLRGYVLNTDPTLQRELFNYGSNDPTQPPQLATLFSPNQVPPLSEFYRVRQWIWAPSPAPGMPSVPIGNPDVTALSFSLPAGTSLRTPTSGYDIGNGMEVIVLFADQNTVTLHYTRDDSAARGYTIHIDNICTDPTLLSLYNNLDNPNGPRYDYPSPSYPLPVMPAGKVFGTTGSGEMVVAVVDSGAFQDPRSCNDWWKIRPGYPGSCPPVLPLEGFVNLIVN
jgi:hypothetical protein